MGCGDSKEAITSVQPNNNNNNNNTNYDTIQHNTSPNNTDNGTASSAAPVKIQQTTQHETPR